MAVETFRTQLVHELLDRNPLLKWVISAFAALLASSVTRGNTNMNHELSVPHFSLVTDLSDGLQARFHVTVLFYRSFYVTMESYPKMRFNACQ